MRKRTESSTTSDLKKRIFFVLFALLVFRIGNVFVVPGIDASKLLAMSHKYSHGVLGIFSMFTGGALQRMTIFALGVMPYISASIIIQLFTPMSPSMKQLQSEGAAGRRKLNQYTRYLTAGIAFVQAIGISKWLMANNTVVIHQNPIFFYFVAVVTLVTGAMFLMWLGEQVTERGIGNGISLLITAGILSRLPSAIGAVFTQVQQGQMQVVTLLLIITMVLLVVGFVVFFESAQRRIATEYPKRHDHRGRGNMAQKSHLPLKLNTAGVIPVIFAQAITSVPGMLASSFATAHGLAWLHTVALNLSFGHIPYFVFFFVSVFFFSFFWASINQNPRETADQLKQQGVVVARLRPGKQTAQYIEKIMDRLTVIGATYLSLVAILPQVLTHVWGLPFYFGGTSILIVVVVLLDFGSQLQSHLMSSRYSSLMKSRQGGFVK